MVPLQLRHIHIVTCIIYSTSNNRRNICFYLQEDPEIWVSDSDSEEDDVSNNVSQQSTPAHAVVHLLLLFITMWQAMFKVSKAGINSLLRFFKHFFKLLGNALKADQIAQVGDMIPLSIKTLYKSLNIQDDFICYVVCPSCHSVYQFDDCIERRANNQRESKRCCHIKYPNHPKKHYQKKCNTLLLKQVRTKSGYCLKAKMTYPYMPLRNSLQKIIKRKGILEECEKWRSRETCIPDFCLGDIYDGNVWKLFCSDHGYNFLKSPHCFLLGLNVDWFQPFERSVYSVGAIYLTVLNFPRDIRYKPENIILVGIIPGPTEPKYTINSFLTPLVVDLQKAWTDGFQLLTNYNDSIRVRVALACVSCDVPASRKVCGFLGINATFGCNKCLKRFGTSFRNPTDFSGFDRENWELRTVEQHRQRVNQILTKVTKTSVRDEESKYGIRYSVLLLLPYFDPIKLTAIDVMHNIFLGTGKHMLNLWFERNILSKDQMVVVESLVNEVTVPADIGRLPAKISSGYGGFTANQWKNWITVYSAVVLKGILPNDHLQCWLLYVRACSILCSRFIQKNDVNSADLFLLEFCRKFEKIYGPEACTANTHLHLHLKQSILDFGPSHAFWCFSFERFNGILGSYHTNNKSIEVQLMRKFNQEQVVQSLEFPSDLASILTPKAHQTPINPILTYESYFLSKKHLNGTECFISNALIHPLPPFRQKILSHDLITELKQVYSELYPSVQMPNVSPFYDHCGRVVLGGDVIGSSMPGPNNATSSVVMAFWSHTINLASISYNRMLVGIVQFFLRHRTVFISESSDGQVEHVFAYVKWKRFHPHYDWFGISATVCTNDFESSSFIPIQRIACRCAYLVMPVQFDTHTENCFVACPIPIRYFL